MGERASRRNSTLSQPGFSDPEFSGRADDALERNIPNKMPHGGFAAMVFAQCMQAIGGRRIHLGDES